MREQLIETNRNAYTKLKAQDVMLGDTYQQSAEYYADIVANCAGKCGWLQAALETAADTVNFVVYALLGGGAGPTQSAGVKSTAERYKSNSSKQLPVACQSRSKCPRQGNSWPA